MDVTVDLTHRVPGEIGLSERKFEATITPVFVSGMPRGSGWTLHGVVKSRLTLNVLSMDFGERAVHGQPPPRLKALATAHVQVDRLEATVDPIVAIVQIHRRTDDADKFDVFISPQPALPPGSFKTVMHLDVITSKGEHLPGTTLKIMGQMQQEIRPLPARLLLGSRRVGETAEAAVVLQAPANLEITIAHIEADSLDVQVEPIVAEGSPAGRTFRILQRVVKVGDQKSIVRFIIPKPGQKSEEVAMEVSYRGEARDRTTERK